MCPADDSHLTFEFEDHYVIAPSIRFIDEDRDFSKNALGEVGEPVEQGFEYHSGTNNHFLDLNEIGEFNDIADE